MFHLKGIPPLQAASYQAEFKKKIFSTNSQCFTVQKLSAKKISSLHPSTNRLAVLHLGTIRKAALQRSTNRKAVLQLSTNRKTVLLLSTPIRSQHFS